MTQATRRGLGLIGISLLIGILGDALLRAEWGINVPLWLGLAIVAGWALLPDASEAPRRISGWPLAAAMGFALFVAWRDSEFLMVWNTIAALAALTLPILESKGIRLGVARVSDYAQGALRTGVHAAQGLLAPVTRDIAWGELGRFRGSVGAVAIGTTLTVPTVLVFGSLLASADRGFAQITSTFIAFDVEMMVSHAMLAGILAWLTAGYLSPLVGTPRPEETVKPLPGPSLGLVEVATPLVAVVVLFATYVILQLGYLFGGEAAMNAAGLTYAQYAREGFEELVTASALVLPLLLGANWLFQQRTIRNTRIFNIISATLIGLCGLLMVSALHRDALYIGQYGLSHIRLYAAVFLGWVGIVHLTFLTTVLRGLPEKFATRSVISGLGVLALLNVANPDAMIARSQLARAQQGAALDTEFLGRLSADATPVLAAHLPRVTPTVACELYHSSLAPHADPPQDWRSWNRSRMRARAALERNNASAWVTCQVPEQALE